MSETTKPAPVPLVDLKAAHAEIDAEVRAGFDRVLATGAFVLGPEVRAFEEEFAAFCEVRHCVGVSSGTDALELVLRAGGVGPGDEVIVPVNTFIATATAVSRTGATPVFVDCDAESLLIDPERVAARITDRTKALMPVHLYGQVAPMQPLVDLARDRGLLLFEDNAQSQGARQDGRVSGSFGLAAATSFYPGKNLGAYGDAGAVVTDDEDVARTLRAARNYGSEVKYEHPLVGFNCRLDSLQAVVLRAKLARLADWNDRRRAAAARYDAMLADVDGVRPLRSRDGNEHVYHLYVVRVQGGLEARTSLLASLHEHGIGAGLHYPTPLHLTGAYADQGHGEGAFPVAEAAADEILSLPLFPQITADQQERVVHEVRRALA